MSFFISDLFAANQTPAPQGDGIFSLLMFAGLFVLLYFVIIRPQNKRAKEQRDLLSALKKGDEVITTAGILAKVTALGEQYIKVSPTEGVEFYIQKVAVITVLPKGTMKSL